MGPTPLEASPGARPAAVGSPAGALPGGADIAAGLRLRPRRATTGPVDGSALRPDTLAKMSRAELAALPIRAGRREHPLGDLFEIEGDPAQRLTIESGPGPNWIHLGAGMAAGELIVQGDAGDLCGMQMAGGSLHVCGSAGTLLGAGMSGGLIRVDGSAGDLAGGPPPTSAKGMTGGEILITGALGERTGHRMRRGLLAAGGPAGAAPGHVMIAGTLVIASGPLIDPGSDMRRGTLVALDPSAAGGIGANCAPDTVGRPVILGLLFTHLSKLGFALPAGTWPADYRSYSGDRLGMGRGEIFVRVGG